MCELSVSLFERAVRRSAEFVAVIPPHVAGESPDGRRVRVERMSVMLSVTTDHALRAVLFLGREYRRRLVPADEIAAAIGAPANYLSKTLGSLGKAGIVVSNAGRQGGFALAVPPHRLTLQRVVEVFEPPKPSERCLMGNRPCNRDEPCSAHRRWTSVRLAYRDALRSTTVADLLGTS